MAEETESKQSAVESMMEKVSEKIHAHDSSSSSDSDHDKPASPSSVKAKIYRLFGRERPIHHVLGCGKPADVFLWRNKKISAGVLGGATAIWVLFELIEYQLLTLVCHISVLALALLFLWSNVHTFIHKTTPHIPQVHLPEEPFLQIVSALTIELNRGIDAAERYCLWKKSEEVSYDCSCPLDPLNCGELVQLLDLVLHIFCVAAFSTCFV